MRVGLFINGAAREGAICAFDLVRAFRERGHDMAVYAPDLDASSDPGLWIPFRPADWSTRGWWNRQALDLAIFYGIARFPAAALQAARQSGATVLIEADTDGRVVPSQNPIGRLVTTHWDSRLPLTERLRSAKAWFDDCVWRGAATEALVLGFLAEADFIKVESSGPAEILRGFLRSKGKHQIADRIVEIPFAARDCFTSGPLPVTKDPTVLLAGRLAESQKGPRETVDALRLLLKRDRQVSVEIHLRGDSFPGFDMLASDSSRVHVFRNTGREDLADRLRRAAILFSRSRWETTPVIALEALCSGATLVAPGELPGYNSLIQGGRFGQTYRRAANQEAVDAVLSELNRWRSGERDSFQIAEAWRKRASLSRVTEQLLALSGKVPRNPSVAESYPDERGTAVEPVANS